MPARPKIRLGSTRQSGPEHYFRVQVSWDGGQSHDDALVLKRDDRKGQDQHDRPYRVEWAATKTLEREVEAALSPLEARFSAKDTKNELRKFLKGIPRHYVPSDTEIPVDLGVRLAESQIELGMHAGKEPEAWEREADAAALRHAGIAERTVEEGGVGMPEVFQWVPWFGELAEKVREGRREGLVERCKKVDWAGRKCVVLDHGEQNADPLTFFSLLASVAGGQAEKREKVYSSVADVFEIKSNLDYHSTIFPDPPAVNLKFYHPRTDSRHWDMFDQACALDGRSYGAVNADTFAKVLRIERVAIPKLTQALFLINPRAFLPFDKNAVLPLNVGWSKKLAAKMSWAEYVNVMGRIRTAFPGCQPYEINLIGYLWTKGRLPRNGNRWYQIGTSDDDWRDFRDNNWIHAGGQGDTHRSEEGEVPAGLKQDYPLDEPKPGDVVLVHSGRREGRGIGVVYRNDYREAEAAARAAAVGVKSLEDLRRKGSGFALVIHQNRGMRIRVKQYGLYQTVLRAAKSEVLRSAVDRLDVRFRADGRVVAYLTSKRDAEGIPRHAVVTEVQDGDDPAEAVGRLGGPKLTKAIPRPQKSHRSGGIHGQDGRGQDDARDLPRKSDRNGRIHVLWVNKAQASLASNMPAVRFSRVGGGEYDAFAKSPAYSATMGLLPWPSGTETPPPPPPPPVRHALNRILYGPPGTGKTWHTVTRSVAIVEGREVSEVAQEDRPAVKQRFEDYRRAGQIEMVTFHQNTTYEDFVEGIRPVLTGSQGGDADPSRKAQHAGDVQYEMSRGVFRHIAERAAGDFDHRYVLIIDEINRGNIARIFGELITLIEDSKRIGEHDEARVTLPGSKTDFGVPANLHVLGTMNTADRSIALLDTALRRRFVFEKMMPDPSHSGIATDLDGIDCGKLLDAMNRRIAVLLDREHQIGHTYLLRVDTLPSLASTFRNRIMPLLQEYFYDDWEKIRAVLNANGFILKSAPPEELVRLDLVDADRSVYDLAPANDDRWTDATAYRRIYETPKTGDADQEQGG